jgi:anti-sigma B factor antagonist
MASVTVASAKGEVVVFTPQRITLGEGSVILREVVRSLNQGGFNKIILDLNGTSYMDSSGLGELVSSFTVTKNLGGDLRLNRLDKRVKDVLMLTKLYTVFDISAENYDSLPTVEVKSNDVGALRAARALPLLLQLRENRICVELAVTDDVYKIDTGSGVGESKLILAAPHILSNGAHTLLFDVIREFEEMINSSSTREDDIHKFLDRNPTFLLGSEYNRLHSKVLLERDELGDLIPDFMLQPFDQELCDVLELKLPTEPVVVGARNRKRFSGAVHSAAAQLRTYSSYFEDRSKREEVFLRHGVKAYRPRLSVVIGRTPIMDPVEYRRVADGITDVKVVTYDDLLRKAKRFLIV